MGCLRSFIEGEVLCALACAFHGLSLSGEEMEVAGNHDARDKKPNPIHVECVLGVRREARSVQTHVKFGCILMCLSSSLQRTQDLSIAFRAEPSKTKKNWVAPNMSIPRGGGHPFQHLSGNIHSSLSSLSSVC